MGELSLAVPLVLSERSSGFAFTLPHLTPYTSHITIQHTRTLILDTISNLQLNSSCNVALARRRGREIENGLQFRLYPLYSGVQMPKLQ